MPIRQNPTADLLALVPVHLLQGESAYETQLLQAYAQEARAYLESFPWCTGLRQLLYGIGVGGVIAVFLAEISVKATAQEWLWVVTGDLPAAYLPMERAGAPCEALLAYCDEVGRWALEVRAGTLGPQSLALRAEATLDVAAELEAKLLTLRRIVLPALCPPCAPPP